MIAADRAESGDPHTGATAGVSTGGQDTPRHYVGHPVGLSAGILFQLRPVARWPIVSGTLGKRIGREAPGTGSAPFLARCHAPARYLLDVLVGRQGLEPWTR